MHLGGSFLPGLISFGDLAWSLEGKMVLLLLKIALISAVASALEYEASTLNVVL